MPKLPKNVVRQLIVTVNEYADESCDINFRFIPPQESHERTALVGIFGAIVQVFDRKRGTNEGMYVTTPEGDRYSVSEFIERSQAEQKEKP